MYEVNPWSKEFEQIRIFRINKYIIILAYSSNGIKFRNHKKKTTGKKDWKSESEKGFGRIDRVWGQMANWQSLTKATPSIC